MIYSDEENDDSVSIKAETIIKNDSSRERPPSKWIQSRRRRVHAQLPSSSDDSESDTVIQHIQTTPQIIPSTPPTSQRLNQSSCASVPTSSDNTSLIPTYTTSVTRKRSLTMLSPEKITTRSTRDLKKVAPMEQVESDASAESPTDIDNDSGF